jgi:hypothetical protein
MSSSHAAELLLFVITAELFSVELLLLLLLQLLEVVLRRLLIRHCMRRNPPARLELRCIIFMFSAGDDGQQGGASSSLSVSESQLSVHLGGGAAVPALFGDDFW